MATTRKSWASKKLWPTALFQSTSPKEQMRLKTSKRNFKISITISSISRLTTLRVPISQFKARLKLRGWLIRLMVNYSTLMKRGKTSASTWSKSLRFTPQETTWIITKLHPSLLRLENSKPRSRMHMRDLRLLICSLKTANKRRDIINWSTIFVKMLRLTLETSMTLSTPHQMISITCSRLL